MAEVLELAQLAQHDGVPEVEVGAGRIAAELDAQRDACHGAFFQLGAQAVGGQQVSDAAGEFGELLGDGREGHGGAKHGG